MVVSFGQFCVLFLFCFRLPNGRFRRKKAVEKDLLKMTVGEDFIGGKIPVERDWWDKLDGTRSWGKIEGTVLRLIDSDGLKR